ncbi:hypothetical protein OG349_02710 [Streptomyces sp. NBC_01317]|uniref:hypothetical protein n=1 Tax=unclassified Streptomyces TaxID=2593676 RepID=UPI002E1632D5|nr:hypothetical protein OG349_02710 [Streptomyces sp. NBC_01317]
MRRGEDAILADELAALAATTGASRRIARLTAKARGKRVYVTLLTVPLPAAEAFSRVTEVLEEAGHIVDFTGAGIQNRRPVVRAVTGGGFGRLNPVVVTITMTRSTGAATYIRLRATSLEGLLRQHASERTAARIAAALSHGATEPEGPARPCMG